MRGSATYPRHPLTLEQTPPVMAHDELLLETHDLLDRIDPRLLVGVHAMLRAYQEGEDADRPRSPEQAAYEASLVPMTRDELVARARASEEDIAAGRVHTLEEVARELGL